MSTLNNLQEPITPDAVTAKMEQLHVTGFSSMDPVSPEQHMVCLEEIERIVEGRKQAAQVTVAS